MIKKILKTFRIRENKRWKIDDVKEKAQNYNEKYIRKVTYRPFDDRYLYYDAEFIERNRLDVMQHFIDNDNLGLVYKLGNAEENSASVMITKNIIDFRSWSRPGMQGGDYVAPLYLYPETTTQQSLSGDTAQRKPNLNMEIVAEIEKRLGLEFLPEEPQEGEVCFAQSPEIRDEFKTYFTPLNLLDYIYAVLHSPSYRETYKEFLKIDFPRVPYPSRPSSPSRPSPEGKGKAVDKFWQLVELGKQIREIHLLESDKTEDFITTYPVDGSNEVTRKITKNSPGFEETNSPPSGGSKGGWGKVWINDAQYFDKVPKTAWKFYIGGYQPAQKWLKDRKGRKLSFEDVLHYQKIIVALTETDRLMKEVDAIGVIS